MRTKTIIKYIVVVVVVLLIFLGTKRAFVGAVQDNYNNDTAEFQEITVSGSVIEQSLSLQERVTSMNFLLTNNSNETEMLQMELWNLEKNHCYIQEVINVPASGGAETVLTWNLEQVDLENATDVVLIVNGQECSAAVNLSVQDNVAGQPYLYNGEITEWHLRMSVVYERVTLWGFWAVLGLILLVIGAGCVYAWDKKIAIEKMFAVVAVVAGIGIALVNPLGQETDGWLHFIRALDVSYGNVLAPFANNAHEGEYNMLPVNINDVRFEVIEPDMGAGLQYMQNLKNIKFSKETVLAGGECGYTSLYYAPQALGTAIGRGLNLSIYSCMVLGRMLNLLCYVVITFWALKLMPIYKNLLAVIALLPMSVYQAASYSPDAMLNALSFLFIALCFYYAFGEKEKLNWKHVISLGLILAVLFTCKYVYVCLGLLVFLIPSKKFGTRKDYWKAFGIAIIPLVLVASFFAIRTGVGMAASTAVVETADAAAVAENVPMTQFEYAKDNPLAVMKTLFSSVLTFFNMYVEQLNTLGWLNYSLNILQTIVPCFVVGIACLDTEGVRERIRMFHRVLCFATGGIVVVMGMLGIYLMDTSANPIGNSLILGYQGRYVIPCMLLLFMTLGSGRIENRIKAFSVKIVGCMGLFLAYTMISLVRMCY